MGRGENTDALDLIAESSQAPLREQAPVKQFGQLAAEEMLKLAENPRAQKTANKLTHVQRDLLHSLIDPTRSWVSYVSYTGSRFSCTCGGRGLVLNSNTNLATLKSFRRRGLIEPLMENRARYGEGDPDPYDLPFPSSVSDIWALSEEGEIVAAAAALRSLGPSGALERFHNRVRYNHELAEQLEARGGSSGAVCALRDLLSSSHVSWQTERALREAYGENATSAEIEITHALELLETIRELGERCDYDY